MSVALLSVLTGSSALKKIRISNIEFLLDGLQLFLEHLLSSSMVMVRVVVWDVDRELFHAIPDPLVNFLRKFPAVETLVD